MEPIERELLVRMFAQMESKDIDTSQSFLWGYFFVDSNKQKLEAAAKHLQSEGYTLVTIRKTGIFGPHLLQVEKVEKHSVDSLERRNIELTAVAQQFELKSYEGMDVGPVGGGAFKSRDGKEV